MTFILKDSNSAVFGTVWANSFITYSTVTDSILFKFFFQAFNRRIYVCSCMNDAKFKVVLQLLISSSETPIETMENSPAMIDTTPNECKRHLRKRILPGGLLY